MCGFSTFCFLVSISFSISQKKLLVIVGKPSSKVDDLGVRRLFVGPEVNAEEEGFCVIGSEGLDRSLKNISSEC